MIKKLHVVAGPEHPHGAQKPVPLAVGERPAWDGLPVAGDRPDPDDAEGLEAGVEARRPRAAEEADGRAGAEAGRARGGRRRRRRAAPKAARPPPRSRPRRSPPRRSRPRRSRRAKKPTAKKTTAKKPTAKKTTAKKPPKSEE